MDRKTLAEYLCCSIPMLDRIVWLPRPIDVAGRDKWRKEDIDRALANLTDGGVAPWEDRFL